MSRKKLTPKQLEEIRDMARLQFGLEEVALIVNVTQAQLETGPGARSYMAGRLQAQAEVRKSIVNMAGQGSSPAQTHFMQLAEESQPQLEPDEEDNGPQTGKA